MQASRTITHVKTIGERLAWARTRLGLTQKELATKAGVSQGTIGNIESGRGRDPREILAIASAAQVSANWLKTGKGGPRENVDTGLTGVAHDLSHLKQTVTLPEAPMTSWRDAVMKTPERFSLEVEDDAMAPLLSKGDIVRFARLGADDRPRPGRIVLVADRNDRGYIRFFEDGGDQFTAAPQARSGYRALEEKRDGLRVVALWLGYGEKS